MKTPLDRVRQRVQARKRARVACLAAVIGCAAGSGGCVSRAPLSDQYEGPRELPEAVAEQYLYESASALQETDPPKERRSFSVHEIILAGGGSSTADGASDDGESGKGDIVFEYFDLQGAEATPVVVLLPILNGNLRVTRYFARYFIDQGWAALVVDRERDPLRDALQQPEQEIRSNITDYMKVLDWIEANPELDAGSIGVFGISFGGIDALMLAALDDRVGAVVAAMAGGDLAYLMMNTSYRGIVRQRHRMLRDTGWTPEGLESRIDELIDTDPLALAPYVDAEDVFLVMTRTDMIVPFEAQEALRSRLGQPETLYLPTGHRTSVIYFPLMRSSAYEFFERQFQAVR